MQTARAPHLHRFAFSAVSIAFVLHAWWLSCVAEDAYITFRFSRNLLRGHGLVWNAGGPPVEGYTNFLWMLLSALWIELGVDPGRAGQIVGVLAGLGVILYAYRFARRLFGQSRLEALVPVALLASSGPHAAWATSGLETSVFELFTLAGIYHFLAYEKYQDRTSLSMACASVLMAILTRPEGMLLLAGLCGVVPVLFRQRFATLSRDAALSCGSLLLLFAIYFGWRCIYFGYPLPNTYYAKTGGGWSQVLRGLRHSGEFAYSFALPLLPLALAGSVLLWRASPRRFAVVFSSLRDEPAVTICTAFSLAYTAYICAVGGDYMAMYRFFVPLLPFLYLLVGRVSVPFFGVSAVGSGRMRGAGAFLLCLALGGTFLHSTPIEAALFPSTRTLHGTYRGIQFERWAVERFEQIGRFFARYHRQGEELATGAIGAVSYYSDMTTYGFHGLVDPRVAHGRAPESMGSGPAGHERSAWEVLLEARPAFLLLGLPQFTAEPSTDWPISSLQAIEPRSAAQRIQRDYRVVSEWVYGKGDGPQGYFRFLQRVDRSSADP